MNLKPCPFCGCEYDKDDDDFWYAGDHEEWCPLCITGNRYGSNFIVGDTENEISAWNRRADECDRDALSKIADEFAWWNKDGFNRDYPVKVSIGWMVEHAHRIRKAIGEE